MLLLVMLLLPLGTNRTLMVVVIVIVVIVLPTDDDDDEVDVVLNFSSNQWSQIIISLLYIYTTQFCNILPNIVLDRSIVFLFV